MELFLKNAYSRGFGYYMEVLFCNYLTRQEIPFAHESNKDIHSLPDNKAINFADKIREALLKSNSFRNLFAYHFPKYFDYDTSQVSKKVTDFNLKDWDPFEFLDDLIKTNFIEIARWERGTPVVSEIKSSWGPFPNNKVTISMSEILKLHALRKIGVPTSLIYIVALETPKWVEIPLEKLHLPMFPDEYLEMLEETVPVINETGRLDRDPRYYFTYNLTIPADFRSLRKMIDFPKVMYSFNDILTIIKTVESVAPVYYLPSKTTHKKIKDMLSGMGNK